jgi:hypothetical protein
MEESPGVSKGRGGGGEDTGVCDGEARDVNVQQIDKRVVEELEAGDAHGVRI